MRVLTFDCHVPGWCSFRIPHSINAHLTYPAPPPTTIYGLISNALGLWYDDYSLMEKMKIGIRILRPGSKTETYTRWMKWNAAKGSMHMTVVKQKLIQPAYRCYICAEDSLLHEIVNALENPSRILYLGDSDDMVELSNILIQDANETTSAEIDSTVPADGGFVSDAYVVRWPVKFDVNQRSHTIQYELVYIGKKIQLSSPVSCWRLSHTQDCVVLGGTRFAAG
jgi:CRISPR-associated protein Cas5 subtype I-B